MVYLDSLDVLKSQEVQQLVEMQTSKVEKN